MIPLLPSARLGSSAWLLHLRSFAVAGQLLTILFALFVVQVAPAATFLSVADMLPAACEVRAGRESR